MENLIPFVGLASGIGGGDSRCSKGPLLIRDRLSLPADWRAMILPDTELKDPLEIIESVNRSLSQITNPLTQEGSFFISVGGDHSSAIGVWSGVASALRSQGDIGLIWIDAHMDAHTPQTTVSGNIHGMPLAVLLGHGERSLTQIGDSLPKVKPENICLIGVRSFELGEAELLKKLNVRIYFMQEVIERGVEVVMKEALEIVSRNTIGFGVSFDLDSIDPRFAPGVGCPVPNGLKPDELLSSLSLFEQFKPLAFELVEYNPELDIQSKSLILIEDVLHTVINPESVRVQF